MNRTSLLSFFFVIGSAVVVLTTSAQSQSGGVKNLIFLQPTTPGVSQSGHANISGTARAAQFVGGGAGLSGVNADLLDGLNSTAFLQAIPNPLTLTGSLTSGIISGTNANTGTGAAGLFGSSTAATGVTYGVFATNASNSGRAVFGDATATSGLNYGGRFESASTSGRGVYGLSTAATGSAYGVFGQSQSSTGRGIYGSASASSGTNYGGYFDSNSTTGYGVYANSAGIYGLYAASTLTSGSAYGVFAESDSTLGRGVWGRANATTGTTYGVWGQSLSSGGRGVYGSATATTGTNYGGYFDSNSTTGYGVYADSAGTYGVYGRTTSSAGRAVFGIATSTIGVTYGVRGEAASGQGIGVWGQGESSNGIGVFGTGNQGVWGNGSENGVYGYAGGSPNSVGVLGKSFDFGTIAVLGQQDGSLPDYGVYSGGDFGASGSKAFRIDHPQDPENKYLLHYSSESPYPQNFYSGNAITDSKGKAWVELPDYFHDINANFKYQLTVIDNSESAEFVQVKVAREIENGRFMIMTSAPNTKVSWRVEADRNDLWVKAKPPVDVKEKPSQHRGKYQHPWLYNQPESKGVFYSASREAKKAAMAKAK